ncbi:hypothetical protein PGT21_012078 [Puccinia graminis f. sp. tritici]|uniref:Uncharacterized protein n=1 Tax=Puccinia graminis f. sp. tritici TaxID=56615 RepID=A0A5B0LXD9_PUCGR|nr:hypothetical protein PGT21_012078 [Puccinia graminis f. sp. tritici]
MVGPHLDIRSDADIRCQFQRNCTSASAPAPASGNVEQLVQWAPLSLVMEYI